MRAVYIELHDRLGTILQETLEDPESQMLAKHYAFVIELQEWHSSLEGRKENALFEESIREYQFAMLALMQGTYRHAFMSLRLFLELSLSSIFLSTNSLHLQEWIQGRFDTKWSSIVDAEAGLLSKRFARAFFPELVNFVDSHNGMAIKAYRECSEFVHGNFQTHGRDLSYDREVVSAWCSKADVVATVVVFALCLRYLNELETASLGRLETSVMNRLGHFADIRARFGGK
jgi:hypothetical protein